MMLWIFLNGIVKNGVYVAFCIPMLLVLFNDACALFVLMVMVMIGVIILIGGAGFDDHDSALNFQTIHIPNMKTAWALLNVVKHRSVNWGSNQVRDEKRVCLSRF
jgi:hypothetical protein